MLVHLGDIMLSNQRHFLWSLFFFTNTLPTDKPTKLGAIYRENNMVHKSVHGFSV